MRWCFAWASLITAWAEGYFNIRGKFQAPVHSFISLCMDKVEHFAADKLKRNVLPLKFSLSLKQAAYKSSTLPVHQLGQGPLVQLCKKNRLATSPQNVERQVSEIRSRVISNSGKQSRALQSEKLSNYRL